MHLAEDPSHKTGSKEDNKDLEEEHPDGGVYMVRDAGAEVSEAEESVATSSVGRNAVGVSASPNWSVPQRAATEASSITM